MRSPIRPAALRRAELPAERLPARPPATEPPVWMWGVAVGLAALVGVAGLVEIPVHVGGVAVAAVDRQLVVLLPPASLPDLAPGQPVLLDGGPTAQIVAVAPDLVDPAAFGLDGHPLRTPAAAAHAAAPAGVDVTTPRPARVRIGSRSLLSRILSRRAP